MQPTCAPGWTVVDRLRIVLATPEARSATLEVVSGPLDERSERTEVFRRETPIEIRLP